jgi:hypothetical protein
MTRFAWGTFCLVLQLMPIVAFGSTGLTKFGCDNDRISVAVEPQRSAIEIFSGAGKGDYLFASNGVATPTLTYAQGTSAADTFKLYVRKDHWGRVTITSRQGQLVADELVFCNNPN